MCHGMVAFAPSTERREKSDAEVEVTRVRKSFLSRSFLFLNLCYFPAIASPLSAHPISFIVSMAGCAILL